MASPALQHDPQSKPGAAGRSGGFIGPVGSGADLQRARRLRAERMSNPEVSRLAEEAAEQNEEVLDEEGNELSSSAPEPMSQTTTQQGDQSDSIELDVFTRELLDRHEIRFLDEMIGLFDVDQELFSSIPPDLRRILKVQLLRIQHTIDGNPGINVQDFKIQQLLERLRIVLLNWMSMQPDDAERVVSEIDRLAERYCETRAAQDSPDSVPGGMAAGTIVTAGIATGVAASQRSSGAYTGLDIDTPTPASVTYQEDALPQLENAGGNTDRPTETDTTMRLDVPLPGQETFIPLVEEPAERLDIPEVGETDPYTDERVGHPTRSLHEPGDRRWQLPYEVSDNDANGDMLPNDRRPAADVLVSDDILPSNPEMTLPEVGETDDAGTLPTPEPQVPEVSQVANRAQMFFPVSQRGQRGSQLRPRVRRPIAAGHAAHPGTKPVRPESFPAWEQEPVVPTNPISATDPDVALGVRTPSIPDAGEPLVQDDSLGASSDDTSADTDINKPENAGDIEEGVGVGANAAPDDQGVVLDSEPENPNDEEILESLQVSDDEDDGTEAGRARRLRKMKNVGRAISSEQKKIESFQKAEQALRQLKQIKNIRTAVTMIGAATALTIVGIIWTVIQWNLQALLTIFGLPGKDYFGLPWPLVAVIIIIDIFILYLLIMALTIYFYATHPVEAAKLLWSLFVEWASSYFK